ncbi:hypothetical protein N3K66_000879 [Trichothecium roseum]|uniref:Uncharacterized protein n=1 Tax=Trichothecium roseum TaxID=47278 RepID=A0ACC0VEU3_9HYPO|nr:hypothetical protein N3K66_000879 [Trichothecium roseum]
MRFTLHPAILTTSALCAPAPAPVANSGRAVVVSGSNDEDAKFIYPDYRRRAIVVCAEGDEDAKVIYPDS